jgi:hypothetical protein
MIYNDPARITAFEPYNPLIRLDKLKDKNIKLSPSIGFPKHNEKLMIGGEYLRTIGKVEARANVILK